MDLLYWKRRASQTEVLPVTKQFFKKYLYKMTIYAPGCRSILYEDVAQHLQWRTYNNGTQHYSYGGSWYNQKMARYLQEADIKHLKTLQDIRLGSTVYDVKVRVEEPRVDIYAHSEDKLKLIAEMLDNPAWVLSVCGPQTNEQETLLADNKVLRKRKPKWQYRVKFSEKKFPAKIRNAVWNYLNGLDNEVSVPKHTYQQLTKDHDWMWGGYFHTNDPGIVHMIQLISPDFVREVSELVQIDTK